ncbi:TRAP dicarboxylate transporter, DctM subunit, unknown substrate 6 [Candidatus Rhodobacter oscarellae]|uniref:TRAP C4-dicarboxylate transport system permease DctM subunit domain-containing protein n=1 Tax=Candidatus Rhodobacter oscarellae TaxID=1675527 RepID=A0A0J9E366_9RHOB|nr:TRAP transporter large permease subunit [Candidatus Rhodobacter lobularis]KMW56249.1 TRAP dicarboxylate transporter, DctM subunit, unknown substrate 6 [Candidatus Rhodobacter lobularis]
MELFFLAVLVITMAVALGSGYPVAFALPGAALISIVSAAVAGWAFESNMDAYFHSGGPGQWISAGVTNLRGVYWEVERDTLIAIPLFIFMGIMLQRSKIAEDLLVTMARLFGPVPGGLGISVVFVGALLAATTGIVGATVVAMGLISLPAMLRNNYSQSLATGTIAASGTLGQIIPPSIVLIILADQLASAADQASTLRKSLHKEATGELSMPSVFDVTSTSAGEMFLGAFIPGIVLVLLYMAFILIFALIRPKAAPAVPYEGARDARFWGNVLLTLVPPLALIFLVLGSIISGIATVNQAGAIGAAGALIMAGYRLVDQNSRTFLPAFMAIIGLALIAFALNTYNMNIKALIVVGGDMTGIWLGVTGVVLVVLALIWSGIRVLRIDNTMHEVMIETAKTTSLVFIILLGAAMLTAAFRAFGGEELVREFLNALPGGFWTQFIIVMAVIFVLGFFLDFIEIAVVVVPIVAPILLSDPSANITAVWLGVMIGLNIQTSFLTPPFGFALFYLRGVAPAIVKTVQIYKGVIAFICLQLLALGIVGYHPQLVNYLPNRVSLLGDAAPPPRNPKLQYCLENYVHDRLQTERSNVLSVINTARGLDLSLLPKGVAGDLEGAFDEGEKALSLIEEVKIAEAAVQAAAPEYRPLLRQVRHLEKRMRKLEAEAKELRKQAGFLNGETNGDRVADMLAEAAHLDEERAAVAAQIPPEWDEVHDVFAKLTTAEQKARTTYRRAADGSVEDVQAFLAVLNANAAFAALEGRLMALEAELPAGDRATLEETVKGLGSEFNAIAGANKVGSELSKARRALREGKEDREKALKEWGDAVAEFQEQLVWRKAAEGPAKVGLEAYIAGVSDTVGARQQPAITREQALFLANCNAAHRDISLNF